MVRHLVLPRNISRLMFTHASAGEITDRVIYLVTDHAHNLKQCNIVEKTQIPKYRQPEYMC